MSDTWFENAPAEAPLTQGDLIAECPLLGWRRGAPSALVGADATFDLAALVESFTTDVVVMTQACDLEQSGRRCPLSRDPPQHISHFVRTSTRVVGAGADYEGLDPRTC